MNFYFLAPKNGSPEEAPACSIQSLYLNKKFSPHAPLGTTLSKHASVFTTELTLETALTVPKTPDPTMEGDELITLFHVGWKEESNGETVLTSI
jgi:hypothetical protein